MGLRQEKLADEIRDILASCFQGGMMSDPRLDSVTITAVKVSADLQLAYVYYRLYSTENSNEASCGLESASGFLRNKLAKSLDVRRVPTLKFFYDTSVENASKIEELLKNLHS